uniref:Putative glutamate--cysteine ligase 2 n=1 Tax=uncultured bacterium BLR7 TaxID=506523 RepID=C0INN5_9BACT|nr:hypothetical protein bll3764 [uncultured bacterium BLR7]
MFAYRIGIEEEYFVSDLRTGNVRKTMSKAFYSSVEKELGDAVTPELLQSQIEIRTPPCSTMQEARQHLSHYRRILAREAVRHSLAIVASGTHPAAVWHEQQQTPKERYGEVRHDLQMLAMRNMVCGMHVHVEVPDIESRVSIMYRLIPFLPPLLALSTSSPFWQGHRTGLLGYRLTAYDELPRTGLPELFRSAEDYDRYVTTLTEAGVIKDSSYVWWAVRPSLAHPTLELRVADCCTHVEDTLSIAAIYRGLMKHLVEHPEMNADLDAVGRAVAMENKWRAQRYGTGATFVDARARTARPIEDVVRYILELIKHDTDALDCTKEARHALDILKRGSSADEQIRVYRAARDAGASRPQALKDVVFWLQKHSVPEAQDGGTPSTA